MQVGIGPGSALRLARLASLPQIDHWYFSDSFDVQVLTEGIKLARRIFAVARMAHLLGRETRPAPKVQNNVDILAHLRAEALTVYHPVGTAKMRRAPLAVVDRTTLKTHGFAHLLICGYRCHASAGRGNANAPSMMIGENAPVPLPCTAKAWLGTARLSDRVGNPAHLR